VTHRASPRFWQCYRQLPAEIQRLADENFELLKADPGHPSLHLKKVGRFWSARLGQNFRAIAVESDDGLIWFWIGDHAAYDQLIR
jgi:hypothetical protein